MSDSARTRHRECRQFEKRSQRRLLSALARGGCANLKEVEDAKEAAAR
jgi:hypothetical protein